VLIGLQYIVFGIVCASVVSVLNLPYQLIFCIQGLILVLSDHKSLRTYLRSFYWLNRLVLLVVVIEVFVQYIKHLQLMFTTGVHATKPLS